MKCQDFSFKNKKEIHQNVFRCSFEWRLIRLVEHLKNFVKEAYQHV